MQSTRVASEQSKELPASRDSGLTRELTNSPENARIESASDTFSTALAMIASLPLSDAEKADAVRRLMAERAAVVSE
jgi:hypothetical protein